MPLIELDYVISFSSQDDRFPVHNLLKSNFLTNSPWLSSQKDHSRVLKADFQLKKASVITHIDIGNRGSAIVEVLVGRSCGQSDDYVTLLPAVVFMSFSQSLSTKYANGCSSVRMFTKGDFAEEAREEKWDRVRIVCRQSFRNDVQFGLDFLILKGTEDKSMTESIPTAVKYFRKEQFSTPSTSERSPIHDSIPESRSRKILMMSRHKNSELSTSDKKRSSLRRESLGGPSDEFDNTRKCLKSCVKQLSDQFGNVVDSKEESKADTQECPICYGHFPSESIQNHVEACLTEKGNMDVMDLTQSNGSVQCPLCCLLFETSEIEAHASNCSLD